MPSTSSTPSRRRTSPTASPSGAGSRASTRAAPSTSATSPPSRATARAAQRLAGPQQRLGRDAGEVRAFAAQQLALDDRHAQPAVGQRGRAVLAGRTAAEDDDVVVAHAPALASSTCDAATISPMWL